MEGKGKVVGSLPEYRADIQITPLNDHGARPHYLLKDPLSGEVLEFGVEEYFLYKQFDGKTAFEDVQLRFEQNFQTTISLPQLEGFATQLLNKGILRAEGWQPQRIQTQEHLFKKIRLGNPDRILSVLAVLFWWCFTVPLLAVFAALFLLALGTVAKFGGDFIWEVQLAFSSKVLFLLPPILEIFVINVAGEIAKAVACKHFGGNISRLDVIMRFRALPRFAFDMTDSILRLDKMTRTKIVAAGPLFQLTLWSIAVIAWKNTPVGSGLHTFWMLFALSASVIVFLNVNPFFQRDGYLLICSWLEIPELRSRALAYIHSWFLKRRLPEPLTVQETKWLKRYGLAVIIFDVLFWVTILGGIGHTLVRYLKGPGAVIFLFILALRFEHFLRGFSWKREERDLAES